MLYPYASGCLRTSYEFVLVKYYKMFLFIIKYEDRDDDNGGLSLQLKILVF